MGIRRVRCSRRRHRKGAEIVELALALPVLFVLVFGTLELCEVVFLKQSMAVASYEGTRLAARSSSTSSDVISRCQQILTDRRVQGASVTVSPSNISNLPVGTSVRVEIRAPIDTTTDLVIPQLELVQSNTVLRE